MLGRGGGEWGLGKKFHVKKALNVKGKTEKLLEDYTEYPYDLEVDKSFLNKTQKDMISSDHKRKDKFDYIKNSIHQETIKNEGKSQNEYLQHT